MPLSAAVHRVSRPFRDLWDWSRGLANARDEVQRLQAINQRQAVELARQQQQLADNADYRTMLGLHAGIPQFSGLLKAFTPARRRRHRAAGRARCRARPDRQRQRRAASRKGDAVVVGIDRDRAALVGRRRARQRAAAPSSPCITSPDFAIGASVPTRQANGLVRPGSDSGSLELDDVPKRFAVKVNDVVSTSGWQDEKENFKSRLPKGIPIGVVTQVNDPGDALVKVIQVTPLVDLDAFSHVLVLTARAGPRRERPPRSRATSSCSA